MDKLIVGVLLGVFFSDPKNRKLATDLIAKGAGQMTDILNRQDNTNVSTK